LRFGKKNGNENENDPKEDLVTHVEIYNLDKPRTP